MDTGRSHLMAVSDVVLASSGILGGFMRFCLERNYPAISNPWINRLLAKAGCEVLVANPRKLRAIYKNERKCDEIDAAMPAKIARLDPALLKPVTHVSDEAMCDRLVRGDASNSWNTARHWFNRCAPR